MSRRAWFPALIAIVLFPLVSFAQEKAAAKKRPNILFIMSDDHASAAIGAYNSWLAKVVRTPNLDRLAKQGIRFTNSLVTNSICTPSRAAILTGQYSHKNGVYTLNDTMDPAHMEMMSKKVQKGRYLFCPNGSHLALYDDQKVYMEGVTRFILDVDRGQF